MQTEFVHENIGIRPYQPEDVPALYAAVCESIEELSLWMPWCHKDYSVEDSKSWVFGRDSAWEKSEELSFVIFDGRDRTFLGGMGIHHIDKLDKCASLGYWVRTSRRRKGVASTAARLAAVFGFQELGINRLEIIAGVGNTASQRVAEKIGAKREGILRKRIWLTGAAHDAVMYSLVPEDFET